MIEWVWLAFYGRDQPPFLNTVRSPAKSRFVMAKSLSGVLTSENAHLGEGKLQEVVQTSEKMCQDGKDELLVSKKNQPLGWQAPYKIY